MDNDEIMNSDPKERKTQAKPARKPYVKPEAVYICLLEAMASFCSPGTLGAKTSPLEEGCGLYQMS
jgi:hypothetical protein